MKRIIAKTGISVYFQPNRFNELHKHFLKSLNGNRTVNKPIDPQNNPKQSLKESILLCYENSQKVFMMIAAFGNDAANNDLRCE